MGQTAIVQEEEHGKTKLWKEVESCLEVMEK